MTHSVLIIYPKGQPNAWLSVNGKSRWTKRGAEYHLKRIQASKTELRGFVSADVRKRV